MNMCCCASLKYCFLGVFWGKINWIRNFNQNGNNNSSYRKECVLLPISTMSMVVGDDLVECCVVICHHKPTIDLFHCWISLFLKQQDFEERREPTISSHSGGDIQRITHTHVLPQGHSVVAQKINLLLLLDAAWCVVWCVIYIVSVSVFWCAMCEWLCPLYPVISLCCKCIRHTHSA